MTLVQALILDELDVKGWHISEWNDYVMTVWNDKGKIIELWEDGEMYTGALGFAGPVTLAEAKEYIRNG